MKTPVDLLRVPPGQKWSIRQPETGVVIESNHWKDFLAKVFAHREANGLFTGSGWKEETWDLYCRQNPRMECREIGQPERHVDLNDIRRFAITFSNWVGSGGEFVEQAEAERRAAICVSCPYNKKVGGCWGCKGPLNWIVSTLGGRTTSQDAELDSCEKCFCSLRAKVHLPLGAILEGQEPIADLPEFCWMQQA